MRKIALLLLTFGLPFVNGLGQWVSQSPDLPNNTLRDVSFISEKEGWVISYHVYHSEDSAYHWEEQPAKATNWMAVDFLDENNGWICGVHGLFSNTNDGGSSWQKQTLLQDFHLNSICRLDSLHGWITGNDANLPGDESILMYTRDGGQQWIQRTSPDSAVLHNVSFTDTLNGWAKTDDLWRTYDGGQTWSKALDTDDPSESAVCFLDLQHGWVSGDSLLYTHDGGQAWINISPPALPGNGISAFEFMDTLQGFVIQYLSPASSLSEVWYTEDGGNTWTSLETPDGTNLFYRGMDVDPEGRFWTVEHGGVVMTARIGDSVMQHRASGPTDQYVDVQMFDTTTGYVLGLSGSFRRTKDGGGLWSTDVIDAFLNLEAMSFCSPDRGWVAGADGMIYSTKDGGREWSVQQLIPSYQITDIVFRDSLHGWIYGFIQPFGPQLIMKTEDGGMSWDTSFVDPRAHYSKLFFIDTLHGWATSNHGVIYYTTDGGGQWDSTFVYEQFFMGDLYFHDETTGWLCGDSGRIYRSIDGGLHWSESTSGLTSRYLADITFADPLHGIAAGDNVALHTYDGGQSWFKLNLGGKSAYAISYPHPDAGWACGGTKGIMRFDRFPVSGIPEQAGTPYSLELIPNPASSQVMVRMSHPGAGPGELRVYDVHGRCVSMHTIRPLQYGDTEFRLDVRGLRPGVYFVILGTGAHRASGKLVKN